MLLPGRLFTFVRQVSTTKQPIKPKNSSKSKNRSKRENPSVEKWTNFGSKTSMDARKERDEMIQHWIQTNWITKDIKYPQCHFFIHDKMLFDNLDLFDNVYDSIVENVHLKPETLAKLNKPLLKQLWDDNFHMNSQGNVNMLDYHMKSILQTIFLRFFKGDDGNDRLVNRFNKFIKSNKFQRILSNKMIQKGKLNHDMFRNVSNLVELNSQNSISFINDRDFTFFPEIEPVRLYQELASQQKASIDKYSLWKYKSIMGDKINDYSNIESLTKMLEDKDSKFMILTTDRDMSHEYLRLLKSMNQMAKVNGCVVLLEKEPVEMPVLDQIIPQKNHYDANEIYFHANRFNDVYDILEVTK